MVESWEKLLGTLSAQELELWTEPAKYYEAMNEKWNSLSAAKCIDWDSYLNGDRLRVLDLGAGTGWLSIMLSNCERIEKIYALDASSSNLGQILPELSKLMDGKLEKIAPILGLFTPILTDDDYFDLAVASAAMHHAPDLAECLAEVHRVVKPGGFLLILNEQPISSFRYAMIAAVRCAKIMRALIFKRWQAVAKPVSENNVVTDPILGDKAYCSWQWKSAIEAAGFSFQAFKTPYYPYQNMKGQQRTKLTHFIAKKEI